MDKVRQLSLSWVKRAFACFGAVPLAGLLCVGLVGPAVADVVHDSSALRSAVTLAAVRAHQQELQDIATANGGVRASGTPGYDESADYVKAQLAATGYYAITDQVFDFPFFQELSEPVFDQVSPNPTVYPPNDLGGFFTMTYSGPGDATALIQPTNDIVIPPAPDPSSTSGCEDADFTGFVAGNIALIQRGTCTFQEKALNAIDAGAAGVIIFNEGQPGRTEAVAGTLGSPEGITVPVIGTSFAIGEDLYTSDLTGDVTVHLAVDTISEIKQTRNIIADTLVGRDDRIVVVGAHLDSVLEGPGINDNGSGTTAILEIALQFASLDLQPRNKVRFAFWGAEEFGLFGSEYYVSQLSARQIKDIALNLNFDMLGSPNFVRFVYDGDGSDTPVKGPTGSANVEDVFLDYFASAALATEPTAFDGRSDYGPFIAVGIPAGGLFSGAEVLKTPEQVAIYGGTAGVAFDFCYHQACDTFNNISENSLDQLTDAAAHAIIQFAETTAAVSGTAKGEGVPGSVALESLEYRGPHLQK